jgi:tripeptidyl-peptidase-1
VKPCDETLSRVRTWLLDNDIKESQLEYSPAKDWIQITLPVTSVERLLDTRYSVYRHEDGSYLVRTPQWSLPLALHEHIDAIQPTNSFLRPRAKKSTLKKAPLEDGAIDLGQLATSSKGQKLTVAEACNITAVTPDCLRTLYGK